MGLTNLPLSCVSDLSPFLPWLSSNGFHYLKDVLNCGSVQKLAEECGILNEKTAQKIWNVVRKEASGSATDRFSSGLDLITSQEPFLLTYNDQLDFVFGGPGLKAESCIELAGCAGTGKTQFCLQLCANVQIPSELDGLSGKAIYLDTEGAFHAERMKQIAQATKINVLQMIAAQKERMEDETAATFENRDFMDNILYKKIDSVDSLIHTLESLDQSILSHHPDVKLLILDSIAFHFRYTETEKVENVKLKTSILNRIGRRLNYLAHSYGLIVVVTNQMTTKFSESELKAEEGHLIPALGDSWAYLCSHRVILSQHLGRTDFRVATLVKSSVTSTSLEASSPCDSSYEPRSSIYCITAEGIRDVVLAPVKT